MQDKQTIPVIAATDEALSSAALVAAVATDIGFIIGCHKWHMSEIGFIDNVTYVRNRFYW